ncbi:MAG TPA: hypothetical protein VFS96_03505, partial [Nitrolancea sp.]|nr:hypothetical protein [Nitrolancea sp.]
VYEAISGIQPANTEGRDRAARKTPRSKDEAGCGLLEIRCGSLLPDSHTLPAILNLHPVVLNLHPSS